MFSRGFISIGVTMGSTASADGALELFVCGRLCLLGEHSDWAGGFRRQNEGIEKGYCIVAGTNEGLWVRKLAEAKKLEPAASYDETFKNTD